MTNEELLVECKHGLGISPDTTALDPLLCQKIRTVKMYMIDGGVSAEVMDSDLAVGAIVLGVGDIWNDGKGGETKFSPLFFDFVTQLSKKKNRGDGG